MKLSKTIAEIRKFCGHPDFVALCDGLDARVYSLECDLERLRDGQKFDSTDHMMGFEHGYKKGQAVARYWCPIESAPKDGSRILAADIVREYIGIVSFDHEEWECVNIAGEHMGVGFYPTHWMPLPEGPSDEIHN